MGDLNEVLKELGKRYGVHKIIDPSLLKSIKEKRVSTGSLALDLELGGGWPLGRIVEVYGWESCGKTMLALKTVAEFQKAGKTPVWIDVENSWDSEWAEKLGVDLKKLTVIQPDTGEEAADFLDSVIRAPETGVAVLDAIADLEPEEDTEKSMQEAERMGSRALMMNRLVKKLRTGLNTREEDGSLMDNLVLFINQQRQKIGIAYGNPNYTPGGMGVKFASAIRLEMRGGDWIEEEKDGEKLKMGRHFKFKSEKNKTYIPYRQGEIPFYFAGEHKGLIDNAESLANYMITLGLATVKGSMYTLEDKTVRGKEAFIEIFKDGRTYNKWEKQVRELYIK